ncbi:alcohol dehydrogenase catalytic domain-containing protein [Erythrobacteraceae bacterium WH01K]|nr:alcohol dehydrogenase catalytic domain-containing protein [Erythrobacteraceae bacterium WH01K]
MRAGLFERSQEAPTVVNVPDPSPGPDGVVLKVEATGACRSDWHGWMEYNSDIDLPNIPGHELADVIEMAGKNVKNWKVGEGVGIDAAPEALTNMDKFQSVGATVITSF